MVFTESLAYLEGYRLLFSVRQPQPGSYSHSIVVIGNFNPTIFNPSWFATEGLIGKEESEGAKVDIIHSDIAIFSLEWIRVEVLRDRFKAETTLQPYEEAVRDLVIGTFTFLRHTPLKQMGINMDMHFRMDSFEKWHEAGHKLAPKGLWEGLLEKPGLISLSMAESARRDGRKGRILVRTTPSERVKPGLFIGINDHVEVRDTETTVGSDEIISMLKEMWPESHRRSENIIYSLLERLSI